MPNSTDLLFYYLLDYVEEWEQTTRSTILKTGLAKSTIFNEMSWIISFFLWNITFLFEILSNYDSSILS